MDLIFKRNTGKVDFRKSGAERTFLRGKKKKAIGLHLAITKQSQSDSKEIAL